MRQEEFRDCNPVDASFDSLGAALSGGCTSISSCMDSFSSRGCAPALPMLATGRAPVTVMVPAPALAPVAAATAAAVRRRPFPPAEDLIEGVFLDVIIRFVPPVASRLAAAAIAIMVTVLAAAFFFSLTYSVRSSSSHCSTPLYCAASFALSSTSRCSSASATVLC